MLVGVSYSLPLILSFLVAVVEFTAPKCASYRPRFGEETCFFSGNSSKIYSTITILKIYIKCSLCFINDNYYVYQIERTSKGIWFFLPMGLALMVNTGIFISIIVTLYRHYSNMKQFKLKNKEGDMADK